MTNTSQNEGNDNISVLALREEFTQIKVWLENKFDQLDIQGKPRKQLLIVADEIFTNIASYAYPGLDGRAELVFKYNCEEKVVSLTFIDSGVAYNPLTQDPPNIAKRIQEQTVGGLGIFMVKKMTTSMEYERVGDKNYLTLTKLVA